MFAKLYKSDGLTPVKKGFIPLKDASKDVFPWTLTHEGRTYVVCGPEIGKQVVTEERTVEYLSYKEKLK